MIVRLRPAARRRAGTRGSRARRSSAPQKAAAMQQLDRRAAVLGLALLQLAPLLAGVHVAHQAVAVGVVGHRLDPVRRHGADAVHRDPDRHAVDRFGPRPQPLHSCQERRDGGIAEAALALGGRDPETAAVVGGREQDDLQPAAHRRLAPGRSPSRWARRRASRRAGARRSETRPPPRNRRRPSASTRARPPRPSSPGPATRQPVHLGPPAPEIVSGGRAHRSPIPRRSSWNAWLWALTIAGTVAVLTPDPDPLGEVSRANTSSPPTNAAATGLRPNRYGIISTGPSSTSRSARLPTSIDP